jgi:hypothetical protein
VIIDCKNDIARPYARLLGGSAGRNAVESDSIVSNLGIFVVVAPMVALLNTSVETVPTGPVRASVLPSS